MKLIIFDILNQCGVTLAGYQHTDFTLIKDIRDSRHLRSFELSISLGIPPRHSLKCSKDDGIFYFTYIMLATPQTLLWHRQSKTLNLLSAGNLDRVNLAATGRVRTSFFLGTFSFLSSFSLLVKGSVFPVSSFFSFGIII